METQLPFSVVKQLPRNTVGEMVYSERVYDRQVLLNESWATYCRRKGYSAERCKEEHSKWCTESWDEFEARVVDRAVRMLAYSKSASKLYQSHLKQEEAEYLKSEGIIERLMEIERERMKRDSVPVQHNLYTNFNQIENQRCINEQIDLKDLEYQFRHIIERMENRDRNDIQLKESQSYDITLNQLIKKQQLLEQQRVELEAAERERVKQEEEENERKKLELEEIKRRNLEIAERQKRIERRKKEQERHNKFKEGKEACIFTQSLRTYNSDVVYIARDSRWSRVFQESAVYLNNLKYRCNFIRNSTELGQLYQSIVNELSSSLLFHCAIYIAVPFPISNESDAGVINTLIIKYASDNCSKKLLSGESLIHRNDPQYGGKTPVLFRYCVDQLKSTGVISHEDTEALLNVGSHETLGVGDFVAFPIVPQGDKIASVLCCDTFSCNPMNLPTSLWGPLEAECYSQITQSTSKSNITNDFVKVDIPRKLIKILDQIASYLQVAETKFNEKCDINSTFINLRMLNNFIMYHTYESNV